ncbi:MAG TPA: hypothetical protein VJG32_14900 [Anaerolineae bacterium]|nr:hypothetical protein [Anaerolineae bacterium]
MLALVGLVACEAGAPLLAETPPNATPTLTAATLPSNPTPTAPLTPSETPPLTTTPTLSGTVAPGEWQTYQSQPGGYSLEYPAGWEVSEQVDSDGSVTTTFTSTDAKVGIMVMVQSGAFTGSENSDIPNVRCQPITLGGLSGTRCFDTLNFSLTTTLAGVNKTYTLATLAMRSDESIYQHLLNSFTPIG